ncbi:MAG TPA: ABC transporter ATP-binding protein [Acidimicrobiales bacterium]|nr:ABC transporter ATP-binding protein [Acidimicrobiales bacterium]
MSLVDETETAGGRTDDGLPALTVSQVSVSFGGVAALTDVNLVVWPGTVTGLIGPNGAGKTTLFNVVSGLQDPDRGTVHFFATDMSGMKPYRRARLGLARTFQLLELFGTLTVGENVQVGLDSTVKWWQWGHLRQAFARRKAAKAAGAPAAKGAAVPDLMASRSCDQLLNAVGLAGQADEQANALPTGLARTVELARGLAIGPRLLLLDEPGSGLDEAESRALGQLLVQLASSGMAVLLVEHDMSLVMRICDKIDVLDFGHVIATGTPDEIRSNPAVQAAYLGAGSTDGFTPGGTR